MLKWLPSTWKSCFPSDLGLLSGRKTLCKIHSDYPSAAAPCWVPFFLSFLLFFIGWATPSGWLRQVLLYCFTDRPPRSCGINIHRAGMNNWNQWETIWQPDLILQIGWLLRQMQFVLNSPEWELRAGGGLWMSRPALEKQQRGVAIWSCDTQVPLVERKGCSDTWGRGSERLVLNFTSWLVAGRKGCTLINDEWWEQS